MDCCGDTVFYDATNPEARDYIWEKCKKNYLDSSIDMFWLDEADPEYTVYDFDNYRYWLGPNIKVGNVYPVKHTEAFYTGLKREGQDDIVNLVRCAWAGSQKYAAFCPVLRMHGYRHPHDIPAFTDMDHGGGFCPSGRPNELWSYGEKAFGIFRKYLDMRLKMKPYLLQVMRQAHETGASALRAMFFEFPRGNVRISTTAKSMREGRQSAAKRLSNPSPYFQE